MIISNATPLIAFAKINQLSLIKKNEGLLRRFCGNWERFKRT